MAAIGFVAYVLELLEPLGGCTARAMFGGYGIYRDGRIFGLVLDDRLFLKTDEECRPLFISAGCVPFEYPGKERSMQAGYWSPPEDAPESSEELICWARIALAAAARKATAKPRKRVPAKRAVPIKSAKSKTKTSAQLKPRKR